MRKSWLVAVSFILLTVAIVVALLINRSMTASSPTSIIAKSVPTRHSSPLKSAQTSSQLAHIFVIMDENQPFSAIIGNSSAPYINSLAQRYALATNYQAVTHPSLPNYLAITSGSNDGITTDCNPPSAGCEVNVNSLSNLSSTTTAIQNKLGSSADVTSSISQANQALQPLNSVQTIALYSLIGSIIAGSVIILMTMVMIVRERRREIGILKAIDASNLRVISQFMVEALTFTILGAVIGLLIGVVGGSPVTNMLVSSNSTSSSVNVAGGSGGGLAGLRRSLGFNALGTNIHNLHAIVAG